MFAGLQDMLAWVKKRRRTIRREDLISFLCGKAPPHRSSRTSSRLAMVAPSRANSPAETGSSVETDLQPFREAIALHGKESWTLFGLTATRWGSVSDICGRCSVGQKMLLLLVFVEIFNHCCLRYFLFIVEVPKCVSVWEVCWGKVSVFNCLRSSHLNSRWCISVWSGDSVSVSVSDSKLMLQSASLAHGAWDKFMFWLGVSALANGETALC